MTDIICSVLNFFRDMVLNHFPDLSIESSTLGTISTAFSTVVDFIGQVNFFIPVPTILLILSIVYGFKLTKFLVFIANWVIRRIADVIP